MAIRFANSVLNQLGSPAMYQDLIANRPAPGYVGRLFVGTDNFKLYRDNGTTYDQIGGGGGGVTSITGTTNQVIASAATGPVTLSLPQSIATTSTVDFANLRLTGSLSINDGVADASLLITNKVLQFANGENNYTLSWNGAVSARLLLNDANNNTQIAIDASNEKIAINDINNGYFLYLDASNGISLFDNNAGVFNVYNGVLTLTSGFSPHISINGAGDFATYSTSLISLNDINNNVANYRVFNLDLFSVNANAHIIVSADNSITGNIDTVNTALVVTAGTGQYPIYVSSVTTISIGDNYDAGNSTTFKFDDFLKTITANNYSDFYFQNGNITAKSFITEGGLITQFVAGNGSLINQSNFTYTSSNGITKTTNDFKLGGTLSQATTITTDSYYLNVNATRQINNAVNYSSVNALTINGVTSNDLGGRAYAANLCETVYSSNANITGQSDTTYTNLAAFTYFISNNYFTTSFTAPLSSVTAWVNFSGSGNVTTYAGIFVKAPRQYIGSPAFTGTLTNFCGLLIDNINASDITGRITNRYAIYQSGANDINYFAGEIRIGNAVSASVLNTVTNKIKIIVGGTTYYLLASTSST